MADIRCPMCAKPNPADRDTCQYCGARIKPVTDALAAANELIRPGEEPTKKSTAELEKALPDWLRNIRQGDSGQESTAPDESDFTAGGEDDFLSRLAGESPSSSPAPASLLSSQSPANNDFLAGLAASGSDDEEVPDWLASIQGQVQKEVQSLQSQIDQSPAATTGGDDWLTRIHEDEKPSKSQPSSGWAGGFGQETSEPTTYFEPEEFKPVSGEKDWSGTPSEQSFEPYQSGASSDTPDWLKSLEASHPSAPPQAKPAAPAEDFVSGGDMPDWLSGLDSGQPVAPVQPASFASAGDDTPDWLRDLESPQPAAPAQPAPFASAGDDAPDWLRDLETPQQPAAPVQPASFASTGDDTPDWLRDLETPQPAAPDQPASFAPVGDAAPDWLRDLETPQPAAPVQPASFASAGDDTPDWLRDLETPQPAAPAQPVSLTSASEDSPDWLRDLETSQPVVPAQPEVGALAAEDDLSGWFDQEPSSAAATPVAASDESLDWFSNLESGSPQNTATPVAAADFGSSSGLPDWLNDSQPSATPAETPPVVSESPDWMSDLGATPVQPVESEPDWLAALDGGNAPAVSAEPAQQEAFGVHADEGIPDWLAGAAAVGASLQAVTPSHEEERPTELPDLFAMPDSEMPGLSLSMEQPQATPALEGFDFTTGEGDALAGELPDWLSGMAPVASSQPQASGAPAFIETQDTGGEILGLDMPDWLSNLQGPETAAAMTSIPSTPALSDGVDDALSPTELPSWVQAMRPVESVISDTADSEEEQFVESQGPLAGMRNVLPMVTGLISIRRPAPYSSKLQVNEVQQSNAALLESMLVPEDETADLAGKSDKSMRFLRWMIALLLVVLVGLPIALGSAVQLSPASNLYPPELLSVVSAIEQLPQSPRVLVVFDYEPSFSGEMAVAATPLLDHLMLRQARLAIVSSIPTGIVQSETLFHSSLALHKYVANQNYINLGYIPGGAVGIYNFANAPVKTLPLDVDGNNPWAGSVTFLADVSQLDQFDAMVVITDSSDTGRIWIEQSRTALGDKPLLMAISAQAEPMLRPYVDSQQVQGMVTGLAGGASYEQRIVRPGLGREYWDSFSVAFLVAEIIVIVGGLWALFAAWRSRRNQIKDEA